MTTKKILLLMLLCIGALCSCGDDDEPLQADKLASVDVKYTYTISEDMLKYFNFTANYVNANGEKVGKQMDSPTLTITTTATSFPANRPVTFTVTRTDVAAPTEAPAWSESMAITVTKHYSPSGNVENSMHNESMSYSPKPEKFDDWADHFIKQMATGYSVTITADGKVSF